jgi:cytochrome c553
VLRLALLAACACLAGPQARAQDEAVPAFKELDSMEARVQGCVTCHGQSGQGTDNGYSPRIADKPAGYLYNQLVAFRDGTRKYQPMNYLVAYLPDAYLREMAEHFARLRPPYAPKELPPADAQSLARGQALVRQGDPQKGIPACMACHGASLTGMAPASPASSACGPPTSPPSSRAGGWASAMRSSPIA